MNFCWFAKEFIGNFFTSLLASSHHTFNSKGWRTCFVREEKGVIFQTQNMSTNRQPTPALTQPSRMLMKCQGDKEKKSKEPRTDININEREDANMTRITDSSLPIILEHHSIIIHTRATMKHTKNIPLSLQLTKGKKPLSLKGVLVPFKEVKQFFSLLFAVFYISSFMNRLDTFL